MNYTPLKKILFVESGAFMGLLAILAGTFFGISTLNESYMSKHVTAKNNMQSLKSEAQSMQSKIVKAKESLGLYQVIIGRNNNNGLSLNRDYAKNMLDKLKQEYTLTSLGVTIAPIVVEQESGGASSKLQPISSNVVVTMEGVTDELVIGFASAIKLQFPGYVRIQSFSLERAGDLTRDALMGITRGKLPALVKSEFTFKWLGVRNTDEAAAASPDAPSNPAKVP